MRIVVLAQEEPVLMAPFLARVLRARRHDVVALGLGPLRDTGRRPRSEAELRERRRVLWTLLEPRHFCRFVAIRAARRVTRRLGPAAGLLGDRALDRVAARLGIPVFRFTDPNRAGFLDTLRRLRPDVILNQSDRILRRPLLELPRLGVVNRHGSRLPDHRGRLASFWQHREGEGRLWVTVHFVDEGLDSGAIILQRAFPVWPGASYGAVLERLFDVSAGVVLEALELLEAPGFEPFDNPVDQGSSHAHPTLEEARAWRREVRERR